MNVQAQQKKDKEEREKLEKKMQEQGEVKILFERGQKIPYNGGYSAADN